MSQHDYVINNDSGASVRADINSALQAILSSNSGTSAPTSTSAGTLWLDTTGGAPYTLKIRDAGNNHWLTIASVTDPGSDGNIETSATIKGTIDSSATLTNATFPAGHQVFITSQTRDGSSGAVYRPTAFYPSSTSDFASKTIHLSIASSDHSAFTKILVNFSTSFRIDKNSHTVIDVRLARWTGTGDVSSEETLINQVIGSANSSDNEEYCCFAGSIVDDISSLGDVQINYIVQYRVHAGNSIHANNIYFGQWSEAKHHMNAFGII